MHDTAFGDLLAKEAFCWHNQPAGSRPPSHQAFNNKDREPQCFWHLLWIGTICYCTSKWQLWVQFPSTFGLFAFEWRSWAMKTNFFSPTDSWAANFYLVARISNGIRIACYQLGFFSRREIQRSLIGLKWNIKVAIFHYYHILFVICTHNAGWRPPSNASSRLKFRSLALLCSLDVNIRLLAPFLNIGCLSVQAARMLYCHAVTS